MKFRSRRSSRQPPFYKRLNRRKMERETDIFLAPPVKAQDEVLLRENSNFVGATATFSDEWEIVPRLSSRLPSGIDPCFEQRQEALTKAARCVCYIGTKQDDECGSGTAFFVSPTILLTAGHVVPDKSVSVVAQLPGVQRAEIGVLGLFENRPPDVETFVCRLVPDKHNYFADITILDCSQSSFRATDWLELEQVVLSHNVKVDVIGYPGSYAANYLINTQGIPIGRPELADVTKLLPMAELTVTHGPVIRGGKMPTYRLSTIGGMSGSPVILNGKAVGVHVGCNKAQSNRCVAFTNESAWKFLKDHAVVATEANSDSEEKSKSMFSKLARNYRRGSSTPPKQPY